MANYASVNNVYSRLRVLLNKQQLGFVTPSQFNQLASQAQQNIFLRLIDLLNDSNKSKLRGLETANRDIERSVEEDLSTLLIYRQSLSPQTGTTDLFDYPQYHAYTRSIEYNNKALSIVRPQDSTYFRNNRYAPTPTWAIAILGNNEIEIIPDTISDNIRITYFKTPMGSIDGVQSNQTPTWGYAVVGEDEVYASANSVDFELPKHLESKITDEIMSLMGISLREDDVIKYAELQQQKEMTRTNG